MKILSLFDGMSCGMIAMLNAGQEIERYVAFEIDNYAKQVSLHNFPKIEQRGDVFDADFVEFEGFDFLMGGSPCTYWSIAQSPDKRETTSSGIGWELFSQYVRALNESKPKFFIYENNKSMSKDIRRAIDETFGFEAVLINSALVSAQNRNRLYWVGKRNDQGGYDKVNVGQPEDMGILLKDILDGAQTPRAKALCLNHNVGCARDYFEKSQNNVVFDAVAEPIRVGAIPNSRGEVSGSQSTRVYSENGKSVNLCSGSGGNGAQTGLYATQVFHTSHGFNAGGVREQNKANTLTTSDYQNNHKVVEPYPWATPEAEAKREVRSIKGAYEVKNGQITIEIKGEPRTYPIKLADGFYIIRKLTVAECARLQTVPDWYDFSAISNTQAYKCLGNGWTCDVITHLINACLYNGIEIKQQKLF